MIDNSFDLTKNSHIVNYELSALELLTEQIAPVFMSSLATQHVDERLQDYLTRLQEEIKRALYGLMAGSFQIADTKKTEYYIRQHQQAANHLLEKVIGYLEIIKTMDKTEERKKIEKAYRETCTLFEELLQDMVRRFFNFIDTGIQLPPAFNAAAKRELSEDLELIEKMYSHPEVNKTLLDLALRPAREYASDESSVVTYGSWYYFKELTAQLKLLQEGEAVSYMVYNYQVIETAINEMNRMETRINIQLNVLLLYMNFNTPEYLAFCTDGLTKKLKLLDSDAERITMLRMYVKFLKLIRLKPGVAYMQELKESITEQITLWIEHEIAFLQQQLLSASDGHNHATINGRNGINGSAASPLMTKAKRKIHLMTSVKELALLIKTAPEAEIIEPMAPADLMRSFLHTFDTIGGGESENSLKNHYFNPKGTAATSLIRKLNRWINVLRRYE